HHPHLHSFPTRRSSDLNITLHFNNTFKNNTIILGDATSPTATKNTSTEDQIHHFSELKYVISNIRLLKIDGTEIPYNINDLDKGDRKSTRLNSSHVKIS